MIKPPRDSIQKTNHQIITIPGTKTELQEEALKPPSGCGVQKKQKFVEKRSLPLV